MVQMTLISLTSKRPRLHLYWQPSCGEAGGLHRVLVQNSIYLTNEWRRGWGKVSPLIKEFSFNGVFYLYVITLFSICVRPNDEILTAGKPQPGCVIVLPVFGEVGRGINNEIIKLFFVIYLFPSME